MTSIKKNAQRLILPWIIFSGIYVLLRGLFEALHFFPNKIIVGHPVLSVFGSIYYSAIAPQMYFLLSLFFIRLLSPIVRYLEKIPRKTVVIIFLLYVILLYYSGGTLKGVFLREQGRDPLYNAIRGFQFYLAGILLGRCYPRIITSAKHISISSFLVMGIFKIGASFSNYAFWSILTQYGYLIGIFTLFLAFMAEENLLSKIGKRSMGIYLLHTPILLNIISRIIKPLIYNGLLCYISITLLVTGLSFILCILIEKLPKGTLLFGSF